MIPIQVKHYKLKRLLMIERLLNLPLKDKIKAIRELHKINIQFNYRLPQHIIDANKKTKEISDHFHSLPILNDNQTIPYIALVFKDLSSTFINLKK